MSDCLIFIFFFIKENLVTFFDILPRCESGTRQSTVNQMYEKVKQVMIHVGKKSTAKLVRGNSHLVTVEEVELFDTY